MISDVLSDAAAEIRDYLRDSPEMYRAVRPRLLALLEQMDELRRELDTPPHEPQQTSADILILPVVKVERFKD